ncbi:MAG: cysteine--tRNA ligase [Magnetococcales bacterium]|nr:cysteine--tRNA ligase [Magnetococcales bacterium]
MGLLLFNSMTRKKEAFEPRLPGKTGIYVCGVTVYDYCHIGHARVMVVFDVVVRHLRAMGLEVTYVRNFTDIDDKIIARAQQNGESWEALTRRFIGAFQEDMAALAVLPADVEPLATAHVAEMQSLISRLLDNRLAYVTEGGDVYFAVDRFQPYGALSGKPLDELQSGARVGVDEQKANPLDFALWKSAKPGEPTWQSPWGPGRPGWHIECSAMSTRYLGESFDIHGGGMDLIFPHHENEIAQSQGAAGQAPVRYWMHNGFVNVVSSEGEREKMSKSLGNFRTIRELLQEHPGEVLRYFILNSHYRHPLDFSNSLLEGAKAALDRLYTVLRQGEERLQSAPDGEADPGRLQEFQGCRERFVAAMDDDFNTPKALAVLFELGKALNSLDGASRRTGEEGLALMRELGLRLGLLQAEPERWFQGPSADNAEIEALIDQRNQARRTRQFAEADRLRDALLAMGVVLEDSKQGTTWRRN